MAPRPVGLEAFSEGTRLRALREAFADPRFVLNGVGALLVKEGQKAFREERMGTVRWKTREETGMVPNWPAILKDLSEGKTPPARRMSRGNTLTDTGMLRGSLAWRVVARDTVEAGSMLPYAGVLHSGGESKTVQITLSVRERLWKWIKGLTGARDRAMTAPDRREKREVSAAVRDDVHLERLKLDLARSKAAYAGQRVPKGERERRQELQQRIKTRRDELKRLASTYSDPMTAKEVSVAVKARQKAAMAEKLRWLLNPHLVGQRLTVRHPARPIIGLPPGLVDEIETIYGRSVGRVA